MAASDQLLRMTDSPLPSVGLGIPAGEAEIPGSETALLESIRAGDEGALAKLYDRYSRLVYSVALRVLHDPAKAEDVLQDVFLKVWRQPEGFVETQGHLGPWLAVIARNRSIDVLRGRQKNESSSEGMDLVAPDDMIQSIETSLLIGKVKQAIRLLPKEQRRALDMAFFRGMTHAEIVSLTGLPLGTVKTRIRTALQFLGRALRTSSPLAAQPNARM